MSNDMNYQEKAQGTIPSADKVQQDQDSQASASGNHAFGMRGYGGAGKVQSRFYNDARILMDEEDERVVQFRKEGKKGPIDVQAPTIGLGGFAVEYDPASEVAWFTIKASVEFIDGMTVDKGKGMAVAMHRDLQNKTSDINRKIKKLNLKDPIPALEQATKDYRWSKPQEQKFTDDLKKVVGEHWGKWFYFECVSPGYQGVKAITMFHLDARPGKKRPKDHVSVRVFKVPDKAVTGIGVVKPEDPTKPRGPTNNVMELDSTSVKPRPDSLLKWDFDFNGLQPNNASLATFADRFQSKSASPDPVQAFIGGKNSQEAQDRFSEVKKILGQSGFHTERLGFHFDRQKGDKGQFVVGSGKEQIVAVHEFGHMLGLGDTYAITGGLQGTGGKPGQRAEHADLATKEGFRECDPNLPSQGRGCVYENNEDVMAMGNLVKPVHSTPFLFGLQAVTGLEWEYSTSQVAEEQKKGKGKKR